MKRFIIITLFLIASFQGFSQQPLFVGGQYLYSQSPINCNIRFVGSNDIVFYDIALTPDGNLWGLSNTDGLYLIDTSNASTKFIGTVSGQGISLVALNNSVLLSEFNDTLYGINVTNAQCYKIGIIASNDTSYYAAGDLSWYGNDLYMTTYNQLIKIELNNDFTSIVKVTAVNSISNPIPMFLGLATIMVNGSQNLIGFTESDDSYILSPIDATFQLLCSQNIGIFGAASISFPTSLPVTLLNFTSAILNKTVKLQWQTTTEINSSYFSIERSSDGVNFSSIGKQAAAGNSNSLKQYSFIDNNPLSTNYYRLKEVDLDGNYKYSNILLVKMPQVQPLIIMGNPVQNDLQIQINNSTLSTNYLSIYDFMGRQLSSFNMQSGVQNIDVSYLTAGTYILQMITADGQVDNKVFVKGK